MAKDGRSKKVLRCECEKFFTINPGPDIYEDGALCPNCDSQEDSQGKDLFTLFDDGSEKLIEVVDPLHHSSETKKRVTQRIK